LFCEFLNFAADLVSVVSALSRREFYFLVLILVPASVKSDPAKCPIAFEIGSIFGVKASETSERTGEGF
jgi:hypothetical protein